LERRFIVDNLRWFKFVGSKEQASGYDKPRPRVGVIYSEEVKIGGIDVFWYAISIQDKEIKAEWQEVYVSDVEPVPQKTFPPDAVTLDTYVDGMWYDVREVLPDERFDKVMFVELYSLEVKQAMWDDKDQKFIRLTGELCDEVTEWGAHQLGQ
jgi:hypothetical protein